MDNDDESATLKNCVLAKLRKEKIKLWIEPYYFNGKKNLHSLEFLASKLNASQDLNIHHSEKDILQILLRLQTHALHKLSTQKYALEIHIIGVGSENLQQNIEKSLFSLWGDKVEVMNAGKRIIIKISNVFSNITTEKMAQDVMKELGVSRVRLVFKGKVLSSSDENLHSLLKPNCSSDRNVVLCLVSGISQKVSASSSESSTEIQSEDDDIISSIRCAAAVIQTNSRFEITDQRGKLVSMSKADNVAFLCALGFHRLGRERMNKPSSESLDTALLFLLEADSEWNNAQGLEVWKEKVDNYGLLQLDIAWAYFKMENLESLPDVLRRLEVAERSLRKQVNVNFLTLALVQADMGNPVPPISAIFVRLFLLQGIALKHSGDCDNKSKEKLDWAWALCRQLRVVAPVQTAMQLSNTFQVSKFVSIAALRKVNGDANLAGDFIARNKEDTAREERIRRCQQSLGLCMNEKDFVDLDLIPKIQDLLNIPRTTFYSEGKSVLPEDWNTKVAVGLLRLANNSLDNAIDIYQEVNHLDDLILRRVSDLDKKLNSFNNLYIGKKNKNRRDEYDGIVVDDVALTILTSMGVNEERARKALKKTNNNVDMSLLCLSNSDEIEDGTVNGKRDMSDDGGLGHSNSTSSIGDIPKNCVKQSCDISSTIPNKSAKKSHKDPEEEEDLFKQRHEDQKKSQRILEKELGYALQETDLEKEVLGLELDEEWYFIEKYRSSSF